MSATEDAQVGSAGEIPSETEGVSGGLLEAVADTNQAAVVDGVANVEEPAAPAESTVESGGDQNKDPPADPTPESQPETINEDTANVENLEAIVSAETEPESGGDPVVEETPPAAVEEVTSASSEVTVAPEAAVEAAGNSGPVDEDVAMEDEPSKEPEMTPTDAPEKSADVDMMEKEETKSSIEKDGDASVKTTEDAKDTSSGDAVIEISAVSGNADVDMAEDDDDDDSSSHSNEGAIKISVVTSAAENAASDEVAADKDTSGPGSQTADSGAASAATGDSEKSAENESKKPMLKLASFADLGSNGKTDAATGGEGEVVGLCGQCSKNVHGFSTSLMWETMIFCNVDCLAGYQDKMNSCVSCSKTVASASLGKFCVRFGSDIKQFCSGPCLEDYKKELKVCSYCQKDISGGEGFLAPIDGGKGQQFKDFCAQDCVQKYEALHCNKPLDKEVAACAVCSKENPVEVLLLQSSDPASEKVIKLCSMPCLSAYKFGNNVDSAPCDLCKKELDTNQYKPILNIHYNGKKPKFCGSICQNASILQNREIVPCQWCKVKKYNFDMIERVEVGDDDIITSCHFCSVNCYRLYSSSMGSSAPAGAPWNGLSAKPTASLTAPPAPMPVIQSVSSLAAQTQPADTPAPPPPVQIQTQTITQTVKETLVKFPEPVEMRNKSTMAKPFMHTKGVSCRPHPCHKSTQTEGPSLPVIAPVAVPMYMPIPTAMYQKPYPVPIPIPIPIPVPVFIPTTRNSTRGIMKQIKKIRAKLPTDPFEAELLAMAGALVDKDKAGGMSDSDDSVYDDKGDEWVDDNYINDVTASIPVPDLESDIKADRVLPKALPQVTPDLASPSPQPFGMARQPVSAVQGSPAVMGGMPGRGGHSQPSRGQATKRRFSSREDGDEEEDENSPWRGRQGDSWDRPKPSRGRGGRTKQSRTEISAREATSAIASIMNKPPEERPDAKFNLKFTYGVNAWRHWVVGKNAELEKARAQGRYMKPFETDILKLRADELNYTLCMFVKEVKKPNGEAYKADLILYLTMGIQEYLFVNGRMDNIFLDFYFEPFTSSLHEVVKDFRLPVNEHGYFLTRIEEEHLWESQQLGSHSPQVLLNTMVYFHTKYYMLKTMDDHLKLSFTHIMKHWKKNTMPMPMKAGNNSDRTTVLRYYPPPSKMGNRSDERKCYEIHENHENPERCPIKLYDYYLSKCPESVKSRSDIFYLQPERSCISESPVWYTTGAISSQQLDKMLQRVLMVREVQEHMLADATS